MASVASLSPKRLKRYVNDVSFIIFQNCLLSCFSLVARIGFARERDRAGVVCTAGPQQLGRVSRTLRSRTRSEILTRKSKGTAAVDFSKPLPVFFAFVLWSLQKVSAPKHLTRWTAPWRPCSGIGSARRNGDTRRSKANEIAPPGVDAMAAVRPSTARPNE